MKNKSKTWKIIATLLFLFLLLFTFVLFSIGRMALFRARAAVSHVAKIELETFYKKQTDFFNKWKYYESSFEAIDYIPVDDRYFIGIPKKCIAKDFSRPDLVKSKIKVGYSNSIAYCQSKKEKCYFNQMTMEAALSLLESEYNGPCKNPKSGFIALALRRHGDKWDIWSIDERKSLFHLQDAFY